MRQYLPRKLNNYHMWYFIFWYKTDYAYLKIVKAVIYSFCQRFLTWPVWVKVEFCATQFQRRFDNVILKFGQKILSLISHCVESVTNIYVVIILTFHY